MDFDEEGEPIYDPDEEAAEEEWQQPPIDDDWQQQEDEPDEQQQQREQSPSRGSDAEDGSKSNKPKKRLVKKGAQEIARAASSSRRAVEDERQSKEDRRRALEKASRNAKLERERSKPSKDRENEMWNSVAGPAGDSEDDNEGLRNYEDDAFIDDTGVDAAAHYVRSDDEAGSAGDAPQAEEGEEEDDLKKIFKGNKKKKPAGQSEEEIIAFVENFMAKMATAAEDDADLNRRSKPAINKLKLLPSLVSVLQKRQYQSEFLDRGVLSLLKNWLEPLPDGSLPNMNIRTAILQLLTDLPIDLEHEDRRDQLKRSGLGKVVMFLSRLDEETTANKKLAKDLVDKWSRPLFQKSTRYESLRTYDEERPAPRRAAPKKRIMNNTGDDDEEIQELRPGQPGYRNHASRPEAIAMDFVVRPQSKVDMEEVQNARKQQQKSETKRSKMNKKLQQLRTPKKRKLQAEKISAEGRGLVRTV